MAVQVDTILGDGYGQANEHNQQVKAEFMQLWEGLAGSGVTVIGATNQPERLNDAVWRRFSSHLEIPTPNLETRFLILKKKMSRLQAEICATLKRVDASATVTRGDAIPNSWLNDTAATTCVLSDQAISRLATATKLTVVRMPCCWTTYQVPLVDKPPKMPA
jgi:SpoVK/Ycf46/Vps4 family AAA+-type ATPase